MAVAGVGETVRLRLDVAYDGTDFSGWASQLGRRTVQDTLEAALATILRLRETRLTVAGRTDAGVHARGQVCHADVSSTGLDVLGGTEQLAHRLARMLPDDVRVRRVAAAPDGFDARFAAIWRRYAYRVCDDSAGADPLQRRVVLGWRHRLDADAMNAAAVELLGERDFAAFCKQREGATTIRTLREVRWTRDGDVLTARVVADAFCHHMVRSVVGCLLAVGEGRQPVEWPRAVLDGGVRDPRVVVAPPRGLTLEEVGYPPAEQLAARAAAARAVRTPP